MSPSAPATNKNRRIATVSIGNIISSDSSDKFNAEVAPHLWKSKIVISRKIAKQQ